MTTVAKELDALVAEHVLGHEVIRQRKGAIKERTRQGHLRPLRNYSTDIAHAWEVVERMGMTIIPIADGTWFTLVGNGGEGWKSPAELIQFLGNADFLLAGAAVEKTPALSICLAAVRAVEKRSVKTMAEAPSPSPSTH